VRKQKTVELRSGFRSKRPFVRSSIRQTYRDRSVPPTAEFVVQGGGEHVDATIVDGDCIGTECASCNRKALGRQQNGVPLRSGRPVARKSPFDALSRPTVVPKLLLLLVLVKEAGELLTVSWSAPLTVDGLQVGN
jgi:hypothetical protein